MGRGRAKKTIALMEAARAILEDENPMTLRQVFYQLVSRHLIENTEAQYNRLGKVLVDARKEGIIKWDWMEDRTRRPHHVSMWHDLADFGEAAASQYRRYTWDTQPLYFEAWLEKDALSGIFDEILEPYGVTLNVAKGFDSWDSIRNAASRLKQGDTILYFGDFDSSGVDMPRSLQERLAFFNCYPEIKICALTADDIDRYQLPPDFAKKSDPRAAAFISKHGDRAVELDALPVQVLRDRIRTEIESRLDLQALEECREREAEETTRLVQAIDGIDG